MEEPGVCEEVLLAGAFHFGYYFLCLAQDRGTGAVTATLHPAEEASAGADSVVLAVVHSVAEEPAEAGNTVW